MRDGGVGDRSLNYVDEVPFISQHLIDHYSAGPSTSRVQQVKSMHEDIRKALDESSFSYETFLQGSYRNDTAIADINDVDIVALRKYQSARQSHSDWLWEFRQIMATLRDSWRVSGSVSRGDKCVKVEGAVKADVVPSLNSGDWERDPTVIYSIRDQEERDNYPRRHYKNSVKKQEATNDSYKATVRLCKRWVRQYPSLFAPSFFIECAVHSVADFWFEPYLPRSLRDVGRQICSYPTSKVLWTVAGDKDILVPSQWSPSDFVRFQDKLRSDLVYVSRATTRRRRPRPTDSGSSPSATRWSSRRPQRPRTSCSASSSGRSP